MTRTRNNLCSSNCSLYLRLNFASLACVLLQAYGLMVAGHSLGAGTASILTLLLSETEKYSAVRCFAFSPPGGLLRCAPHSSSAHCCNTGHLLVKACFNSDSSAVSLLLAAGPRRSARSAASAPLCSGTTSCADWGFRRSSSSRRKSSASSVTATTPRYRPSLDLFPRIAQEVRDRTLFDFVFIVWSSAAG